MDSRDWIAIEVAVLIFKAEERRAVREPGSVMEVVRGGIGTEDERTGDEGEVRRSIRRWVTVRREEERVWRAR